MVCKMFKRGVVGAALGAGALALLFGSHAGSYVKTAANSLRQSAKDNVPVEFQIQRARHQLKELEPAILKCLETVAREDVRIGKLQEEIVTAQADLSRQAQELVALRNHRDAQVKLTSGETATPSEINRDLARRFDGYRDDKKILAHKTETLRLRKQGLESAKQQLENMKAAREVLASKIEAVEAKLQQVQATRAATVVSFDDSGALARVKETVADLEEHVEVMDRVTAYQAKLIDTKASTVAIEPGRDVLKEIDAEFGTPEAGSNTASTDKNL